MRSKSSCGSFWLTVYCRQSLRGVAVIFSAGTQPGGEVTSVLFVSMALQPDLEMTNSAAAGGARLSSKINTQMHTGALHSAITHTHTRPRMQRYINPCIKTWGTRTHTCTYTHERESKWIQGSLWADRCTRGPEGRVWRRPAWCMIRIQHLTEGRDRR